MGEGSGGGGSSIIRRQTKADLKRVNKRLKKENFKLREALNNSSKFIIGLTIYGLVATSCLAILSIIMVT